MKTLYCITLLFVVLVSVQGHGLGCNDDKDCVKPETHKCHKFTLANGKQYAMCLPRSWGRNAGEISKCVSYH